MDTGFSPAHITKAWQGLAALLTLLVTALLSSRTLAAVTNHQIVSLGPSGQQASFSSFAPSLSYDGRYVAFMSYDNSWFPEDDSANTCLPDPNCLDVYMHDRVTHETRKVSTGYDGQTGNEDSVEPLLTADGSLLVFNSYASNLVPGDSNGTNEFTRDGMDVFLYRWADASIERASLDWAGGQILGSSYGGVPSGNGRYLFFLSEGNDVLPGIDPDATCPARLGYPCNALYVRDLETGSLSLLAWGYDGQPPDNILVTSNADYSGRYLTFFSYATNQLPGVNNGVEHQVYYVDRITGEVVLVSRSPEGEAGNGSSGQPQITPGGETIAFRSDASNLVEGDTNGQADIFVYDMATGHIERISGSEDGAQTNGLSRDVSVCEGGRFVSYSSDADNIMPGDSNGARDAFFYDMRHGKVRAISTTAGGAFGNQGTHKSVLTPDCRGVAFASDATDLVPGDENDARDIFWGELVWPADFSASRWQGPAYASPGDTITLTLHLQNLGHEAGTATATISLPAGMSLVPGSLSGGAVYDAGTGQITWSGNVPGQAEAAFSYAVLLSGTLSGFIELAQQATISGDGATTLLPYSVVVNAAGTLFLPLAVGPHSLFP